jgi:alcohol dehydrogenase
MDAVTQLLESYVSLRAAPVTDALALTGLEAARDGLLAWHAAPDGPDAPAARARMALASLLSGICLANTGLGAVHGLASPLGALLPIPHGVACGATVAGVTAANIAALEQRAPDHPALDRYAVLGRLLANLRLSAGDEPSREYLVKTLRAWTRTLAIPRLGLYGLDDATIPMVVAGARGSSMRTNPIELDDEELAAILREAR